MQRQQGGLVPIGEALADLPGPVQALRKTPPPARRGFTVADQVNQLVSASEADPDLGFMARTMALCSLPRTNPGNQHQYKRVNGPYKLIMVAGGDNKLPFGNLPRLILAWVCSEAVRGIESKAGEFYREGLEGSEKRARDAARTDGISVRYGWRRNQFDTFKYSMLEERLEQVREIDGELAYGKMRRALEKASQEKASQEKARQARQVERARQVESARRERAMQETARQSRAARRALGKLEKRRPERGGPERDFGPSR